MQFGILVNTFHKALNTNMKYINKKYLIYNIAFCWCIIYNWILNIHNCYNNMVAWYTMKIKCWFFKNNSLGILCFPFHIKLFLLINKLEAHSKIKNRLVSSWTHWATDNLNRPLLINLVYLPFTLFWQRNWAAVLRLKKHIINRVVWTFTDWHMTTTKIITICIDNYIQNKNNFYIYIICYRFFLYSIQLNALISVENCMEQTEIILFVYVFIHDVQFLCLINTI